MKPKKKKKNGRGAIEVLSSLLCVGMVAGVFPFSSPQIAEAATPFIWTFGGSNQDTFTSTRPTSDGGYISAGSSLSNNGDLSGMNKGEDDAILVKYNSTGGVQWKKNFGGSLSDYFYDVRQTPDGGFVAVGLSNSKNGDLSGVYKPQLYGIVVKYNSSGTVQWKKTFGGSIFESFESVEISSDGGIVVAGLSSSTDGDASGLSPYGDLDLDFLIVKYSSTGTVQWKKKYGGSGDDRAYEINRTNEGGFILGGESSSNNGVFLGQTRQGGKDATLMKLNSSGAIEWISSVGGSSTDIFRSVKQTANGGYIALGSFTTVDKDVAGLNKSNILKFNALGGLEWKKEVSSNAMYEVENTSDNGYVVSGREGITKYDNFGNKQWIKDIGGSGPEVFYSVIQKNETEYVVAGYTKSTDGGITNKGIDDAIIMNYAISPPSTPSISVNTSSPTNSSVTVSISSTSPITEYKIGSGGTWNTYTAPIVLNDNNVVYARAKNAEGQLSSESSYSVSNIDKVAPAGATLNPDKTEKTNANVIITIGYPGDSAIKEYKIGNGGWASYTSPVVISSNETVYARSRDSAGNVSVETSYTVTNIDKVAPGGATFTAPTDITNATVPVTIHYPVDAIVKEYKIGSGGSWTSYTDPVVMTNNGTVYARSKDDVGNLSIETSYEVVNIDNVPPAVATFGASTAPTNANVPVTINFPGDAVVREFKVGSNGVWTEYTSPVVLLNNDTVFARSKDAIGNESAESSFVVSNIDRVSPVLATLTADKTSLTNTDVRLTINYPLDAFVKEYKIGNGAWMSYSTPVVMGQNGTIYARSQDAAGNESLENAYEVTNIDKIAPSAPNAVINGNKLVITTGTDASGIQTTLYQINSGAWIAYSNEVTLADGNYVIQAKSIDNAGNESSLTTLNQEISTIDWTRVEEAVETAELEPKQSNVNIAQGLIDTLPNSSEKDALQLRLDDVQADIDLYNSIQNEVDEMNNHLDQGNADLPLVEQCKDRVEVLRLSVETLPNTMNKNLLKNELNELEEKLNLIEIVLKIKTNEDIEEVDLGDLQDQIDDLPDGNLKDDLQDKLDEAKALRDAIDAVELAETTKSQSDVDRARDLVNQLPNSQTKEDLMNRLDDVQKQINENNGSDPFTEIEHIKDPVVKATLLDVELSLKLAEKYQTRTWIVNALNKVNNVPQSIVSNHLYSIVIEDLVSRVNKLKEDYNKGIAEQELQQKVTVATNYVTQYEKFKSTYYKNNAQTAVSELPSGEIRSLLQERIDAVKK